MAYVSWGQVHTPHMDSWRIGGHEVEGASLPSVFPVMTYTEAMTSYGSDKPDTRFPLKIVDVSSLLPDQHRSWFQGLGDILEALIIRRSDCQPFLRANECKFDDPGAERIDITQDNQLHWLRECSVVSFDIPLNVEHHSVVNKALGIAPGDTVWISRRHSAVEGGSTALGRIRIQLSEIAQKLGDFVPLSPHFLWVTEFPLFTRADPDKEFLSRGRWNSTHHPFTAPMWEDIETMYAGHIERVRGQHYDLVLNGVEIGGGSVRVHDAAMQDYIFTKVLQLSDTEKATFDHLSHALKCGAPPHGGIALGTYRPVISARRSC
ncbi:tRNA synthetases class II-domain-containing protein [Scleroderma yunnanense]